MVTTDGRLSHIDFSKFLGHIQMWRGFKRERAPFVLTPEFVYVFTEGDKESPNFERFVELCCLAFNALRAHARLFHTMFELMLSSGIGNLRQSDLAYLSKSLAVGSSDEQASAMFKSLVDEALKSLSTRLNFYVHSLAQNFSKPSAAPSNK
eukprot:TRINITY_DN2055_c0_g1_i1.p1 TRINITY_DN2055_c0_g1~~TRINITY_DN2055_c0_g1_i1.p1  ORF type:complete len:151 (+),score=51.52 TRINITY_DN2055_c0_g1_i1:208-660(+)